jgi:hypothetical protein
MAGIGFLKDERRLNVAVTRAKRHCCVICDSETVSQSSFIKNLINWIEDHGETRSALEFLPDSNNGQMESDLLQAEIELERMMREPSKAMPKIQVKAAQKEGKRKDEPTRNALLEKITMFAETGKTGESLPLSAELSKFDRKAVHELAEKLGISHQSEGLDGVDRRITLAIPAEVLTSPIVTSPPVAAPVMDLDERKDTASAKHPSFSALQLEEDDDSEVSDGDAEAKGLETEPAAEPALNGVLGDLAKERARREKLKQREALSKPSAASKKNTNNNTKKKGKKLGGTQKKVEASPTVDDGLDDFAFLDAQIDQVQNSHGRKVEGKGGYRTVINGMLIHKPEPHGPKKNAAASSSLQSKLKQAQGDRKAKKKPK